MMNKLFKFKKLAN